MCVSKSAFIKSSHLCEISSLDYNLFNLLQQQATDSQVNSFEKSIKWEEVAPLPVGRTAHTAVLLGDVVYVGEGYEGRSVFDCKQCYRLDVYNLTTNQWSPSITTPYCWFAMTTLDDKLVTAGGVTKNDEAVKKVLVLNAGQWKDYNEMPTARLATIAVGYRSMLIVVGGSIKVKGKWTVVSTTELLDTTNGCWYTCSNLPSPHQQLKGAIMNEKFYLLGGVNKDFEPSPHVFVAPLDSLSTHQLSWYSASDTPWCFSRPVTLYNKFLLILGGIKQSDINIKTDNTYILDPSTGNWRRLILNLPAARSGVAAVTMNNKIVIIGGVTDHNRELSNTVWVGTVE